MNHKTHTLQAVIFDWAGTIVDYGSRAPAAVFGEVFRRLGVEITPAEAREPMGMAKRDHIAAILAMPRVAAAWQQKYGQPSTDRDIDQLYADFLPLQLQTLTKHSTAIPGACEVVAECRRRGLRIGSTTGYTRQLMDVVVPLAAKQSLTVDALICADDVPQGRPAPWMIFKAAEQLSAFPPDALVVVDDTPIGIEAGRNAGAWTVAVTKSGNLLGMSLEELAAANPQQVQQQLNRAAETFRNRGAHFVIDSVADLLPVLDEISALLNQRQHGRPPESNFPRNIA